MEPLLRELLTLQSAGMKVQSADKTYNCKVHLLVTSGDIVGAHEWMHHTGYQSRHGCRVCHIVSTPVIGPTGNGKGRYYPGSPNLDTLRTLDEFKNGAKVSCIRTPSNLR